MMIKNKSGRMVTVIAFIAIELVLSVLLQTVGGRAGDAMRFGAIVFCCLFCLLFMERTPAYLLTQAALACTVGADYFLVWSRPMLQLPAMLFFLVAQSAYAVRLYMTDDSVVCRRWQRWSRPLLGVAVLFVTVIVLGTRTDALALVSMLYYATLVLNVIFACIGFKSNSLLALGLVLFLCCDTVIGLGMLDGYIPISPDALVYRVIHPGFDLAWAFYLPSQVLIVLSLWKKRTDTK